MAREVYQHVVNTVKAKSPELEKHLPKNVGWGVCQLSTPFSRPGFLTSRYQMGLEFRDSSYVLGPKNSRLLKAGMVFNLILAFTDVVGEDGKKWAPYTPPNLLDITKLAIARYSLLLTDTVKVGEEKGVCLTEGIKTFKDVLFSFNVCYVIVSINVT